MEQFKLGKGKTKVEQQKETRLGNEEETNLEATFLKKVPEKVNRRGA